MRRDDMLEVMEFIPTPHVDAGLYLVDVLFKVGPVRHEAPIVEADLVPYEKRRGIQLAPWQADLILDLSKEYFSEMHAARSWNALAPWAPARNMWKYVKDQQNAPALHAALQQPVKEKPRGRRQ